MGNNSNPVHIVNVPPKAGESPDQSTAGTGAVPLNLPTPIRGIEMSAPYPARTNVTTADQASN